MRAVFSESGSRLRLIGSSPILYAMYFGQNANFETYNQGIQYATSGIIISVADTLLLEYKMEHPFIWNSV
jgi:hypothetical protein